ncbi:MAG: hypothetical protein JWO19_4506, partial [Bryobacterales bacterium]|nr:hypothetical protein [Bryobacterales bacterium]MCU1338925.1 hypothetical protein [Bryobacterales bacterium]
TAARAFDVPGDQLRAKIIAAVDGEDPKKLVGVKVEPLSAFYATFAALYICLLRERAAEQKAS